MLTEEDYTDLEQRLFALVNDMGLNFAKYSTLITVSAEYNDAEEDYRVHYTEAKSVLDNIADWRRNLNQPTSVATATVTTTSVATPATPTSVAPPVSVATPHVQTSTTNKLPSIDGAKAPLLTKDGSSRVQTKTPCSATSTSVPVSTYPNILPISSAARNVKFSLPSFVASATGARPKGSYQPFFNPDTTQKTLALTVELIFKIREIVVRTKNVAVGSSNNSNVHRHRLSSSNNDNHLSSQIIRRNLITWNARWLNKNVF
jgi:hypothetical protein